jgi:hypothetical protein
MIIGLKLVKSDRFWLKLFSSKWALKVPNEFTIQWKLSTFKANVYFEFFELSPLFKVLSSENFYNMNKESAKIKIEPNRTWLVWLNNFLKMTP